MDHVADGEEEEEIRGRVLLWHAERDPLVGNMTRYLARRLAHAELTVLHGQGHLWVLDHMPDVLRALLAPDARFEAGERLG